MMLTKAQVKHIRSLGMHKYRQQERQFIAEGDKIAQEWLAGNQHINLIAALPQWLEAHSALITLHPRAQVVPVSIEDLEKISQLQTPNQALLVVAMPAEPAVTAPTDWCLALDGIQDPGNMGTIIRIADWFGIKTIVCSPDCVDSYNPKVVQAGMGGHLRVAVQQSSLPEYLKKCSLPILAATLAGENIYKTSVAGPAVLLIGNESKGIRPDVLELATHHIMIPRLGGAESLNAGVSAGIICALLLPH